MIDPVKVISVINLKINVKYSILKILVLLSCTTLSAQIGGIIPDERTINWSAAGATAGIPEHLESSLMSIENFYFDSDSGFYDKAVERAIRAAKYPRKYVVFFPAGNYNFHKPIKLLSGIVLRGENSDETSFLFDLGNKKSNCIEVVGKSIGKIELTEPVQDGAAEINRQKLSGKLSDAPIIEIFQGKTVYGKSSSGEEKQYQRGQIIELKNAEDNSLLLKSPVRLGYELIDRWGEKLNLKFINPVQNAGLENLSVQRIDKPPKNGGAIILFRYAFNCWISGVESKIGANSHVQISHSSHIEIRGSFFSDAYSNGGGGNGYGVSIAANSSDCLIEDNIFEGLRHAMIASSGANGNVFGYNSSFNKPLFNIDEASISLHGHFPFMNLFESNYVEFANADFVWGANGPYNTFFRNFVYDKGIFGLFRNQQLIVERGTDRTNIVANLANVSARGSENYVMNNFPSEELPSNVYHSEYSYYHHKKPGFISDNYSWPCFGLKVSGSGEKITNHIPSGNRFSRPKKTVDAMPLIKYSSKNLKKKMD